jgi:aryl-alcohol dehydrogenase-like predicted oxidoreductase
VLYSQLGPTGLHVSRIGLGCSRLARGKGSSEILAAALDLGVNFFDTAGSYGQGESERALAPILKRSRGEMYVASKVGYSTTAFGAVSGRIKALWGKSGKPQNFTPRYIQTAVHASLKRLETDYIDLLQLHSPPLDVARSADIWTCLQDLQVKGHIRSFGISCRTVGDAEILAESNVFPSLQCEINVFHAGAYLGLMSHLARGKTGFIARQAFASGQLATLRERYRFLEIPGKRSITQGAIQYVLHFQHISTLLVGTSIPKHLEENVGALSAPSLSATETERIVAMAAEPA